MRPVCFLIATLAALTSLSGCANNEQVVMSEVEIMNVKVANYDGTLAWVEKNSDAQGSIKLFAIHGTPGSWDAWTDLIAEEGAENYPIYAIDRPGWGESQELNHKMFPALSDQAAVIAELLKKIDKPLEKTIVVAHSWGGPVALTLAATYPDLVDGLVLIAAPADPELTAPRWYHKAASFRVIQWVIGKNLKASNVEMMALQDQLTWLSNRLANIEQPTAIMQGGKDVLVNSENADYLMRELTGTSPNLFFYEKQNHFIPFEETGEVLKVIRSVDSQLTSASY